MNPQRMARFVRRWFAEWEAEPPQFGRASQILAYLISARPEEAWVRILALISEAKEESLGYVGAGPLEDLLSEKGNHVIPWLESEATLNPRLVKCVGAVWGDLRFEPQILQRVRNISPGTSY
jgi:hypothetical protein